MYQGTSTIRELVIFCHFSVLHLSWLYFETLHGDKMAIRMLRLYSSSIYTWWRKGGWIDLLPTISMRHNSNWPELRIDSFLNQHPWEENMIPSWTGWSHTPTPEGGNGDNTTRVTK